MSLLVVGNIAVDHLAKAHQAAPPAGNTQLVIGAPGRRGYDGIRGWRGDRGRRGSEGASGEDPRKSPIAGDLRGGPGGAGGHGLPEAKGAPGEAGGRVELLLSGTPDWRHVDGHVQRPFRLRGTQRVAIDLSGGDGGHGADGGQGGRGGRGGRGPSVSKDRAAGPGLPAARAARAAEAETVVRAGMEGKVATVEPWFCDRPTPLKEK